LKADKLRCFKDVTAKKNGSDDEKSVHEKGSAVDDP